MFDNYFKIPLENGTYSLCKAISSFSDNDKNYLTYTDFTLSDNNEINIFISSYKIVNNEIIFDKIDSSDDFDSLEKIWREQND